MNRWAFACVLLAACESGSAKPGNGSSVTPGPGSGSSSGSARVDYTKVSPEETYTKLCAPCHAADMTGGAADHAPALVNKTFLESASNAFLERSIGFGRPGTSMGAYSKQLGGPLEQKQLEALVGLIRSKGPQPIDLPSSKPGDVVKGASIYQKACRQCHGDAVARGEAVHLANPRFLENASDAFLRYAVVNGRPGTKMDAWGGKLSDSEIDDVVSYVRNFTGKAQAPQALLPEPTGKEPIVINPTGKQPKLEPKDGRFVSVDAVKKALDAKQRIVIIDARPPSEWRQVHIEGAVSIPYHDMKRLDEVPKDGTWVVSYCACPHHLSGIVTDELKKRGYDHAVVLDEGINVWHQRGYPVVAAEGVKPPPLEQPLPQQPAPRPAPKK